MSPSATGSGHTWQWGSTAQPRDQQLPARAPGLVVLQAQNTAVPCRRSCSPPSPLRCRERCQHGAGCIADRSFPVSGDRKYWSQLKSYGLIFRSDCRARCEGQGRETRGPNIHHPQLTSAPARPYCNSCHAGGGFAEQERGFFHLTLRSPISQSPKQLWVSRALQPTQSHNASHSFPFCEGRHVVRAYPQRAFAISVQSELVISPEQELGHLMFESD